MWMPQRVLPEEEAVACTTPVEANMQTSSGQPKSGSVPSSSGSDAESSSEPVSSVDAENVGKAACGTNVAAGACEATTGKLVAWSGVQGSEPGCKTSNMKKTPRSRANVLTERLDGNRNGRHWQLCAPMLRRAWPQSRQDCSTELLLRP